MSANDRFPKQSECDMNNPEEHFLWGLVALPIGQVAQSIPPHTARHMSYHLTRCGFVHADHLRQLADENGMIHVDQLPKQQIKLHMPHRGQQHWLNTMGRWVPIDAEADDPVMLPDVGTMTAHEQELIIQELKNIGRIEDPPEPLGPVAAVTSWKEVRRLSDHVTSAHDLLGGDDGTDTGAERA